MDRRLVFDFKDAGFSDASAPQCALNVIVGTEGFSLLALARNGGVRALQMQHFPQAGRDFRDSETAIRTVFGSEQMFSYPFGELHCAFFNLNATLVPQRLFDPADLPAYFKILLRPAEYEYRADELPELGCHLVYALEPVVVRMCEQYFPAAKTMHLALPLLKNWQRSTARGDYEVCVNLRNQVVQVAVFDRQNLLFYNASQFSKASDLLYFVLLAFDQFRLNPEEIPLTVSGHLLEDSDAFRLLHRYVRTVRFALLPETIVLPEETDSLPPHTWYDLFSLSNF